MTSTSVPLWEVCEETFVTSATYDNPFTDVAVGVRFTRGDQILWIDGFYDGMEGRGHVFRVRFAPMFQGTWHYRVVSNDPELNGREGRFECTPPASRGGLVTSSRFPNWLFRADGSPQFIVNDGWTPHPGSRYGLESFGGQRFSYPSEEKYKTFMDVLARHRVNMVIDLRQLYCRQESITETSYLWPWKVVDPEKNRIDKDRFSLDYYQRLDRHILHAMSRGIFLGVELLYDNSTFRRAEWSHHPWNDRNGGWLPDWDSAPDDYTHDQLPFGWGIRKLFDLKDPVHREYIGRYLGYTVARTSAYRNVFYALGCESSNIYPGLVDRIDAWYTHWGDFVAARDPHGRLCTLGDVGSRVEGKWAEITRATEGMFANARNNVITTQEHSLMKDRLGFCDAINAMGERLWSYRRPTVIGEQDGRNNNMYATERRGYWTAFVSGYSMGRVDRHFDLAHGSRLFESDLFSLPGDPPIYEDLRRMAEIVEGSGVRFWRMAPHDELLVEPSRAVYCLAEEGLEYLLYFVEGGTASLALAGVDREARWFNPRTGELHERISVAGGTRVAFHAPDAEDWVLHVRAAHMA